MQIGSTTHPEKTRRYRRVLDLLAISVVALAMTFAYLDVHENQQRDGLVIGFGGFITAALIEFVRTRVEQIESLDGIHQQIKTSVDEPVKILADSISHLQDTLTTSFASSVTSTLQHLDNVVECRYIGLGDQALTEILARLEDAAEVRNTFALFGTSEAEAYSNGQYDQVADAITNFVVDRKGRWTDIVSQDVISSASKGWMKALVKMYNDTQSSDPITSEKAKEVIERYKILRLNQAYPIVNFMIIRSRSDRSSPSRVEDREVIFGWGHHAEDHTGHVFVSRNHKLITSFAQYWHVLTNDSAIVHPQMRPIMASEITGLWFRVSFYVDYDWKARGGLPPEYVDPETIPHDVALIKISISENRNITVSGRRFEIKSANYAANTADRREIKITPVRGFESKAVDIEEFRLWFSTTSGSDEKLNIAGWYRFVTDEGALWSENTRIRELYGEFAEYKENTEAAAIGGVEEANSSKDYFNRKVGRLLLFGGRVPKTWLSSEPGNDLQQANPRSVYLEDFPNGPQERVILVERCMAWWRQFGNARWVLNSTVPRRSQQGARV